MVTVREDRRNRFRWASRAAVIRLGLFVVLTVAMVFGSWHRMIRMPGASHRGPLPSLSARERALSTELRGHVEVLATKIGPRNVAYLPGLNRAVQYLEEALEASGLTVERQSFLVDEVLCHNLWADAVGQGPSREVVVVGAHYDTCFDSPGANDNGSGVAAVLALAGRMAQRSAPRTLRFVLFVNEEPPYFKTDYMGSVRFARLCRERGDQVVAMLSLETMGYYSDQPGSQRYPPLLDRLYPGKGDFIGFVGLHRDRELVRSVIELWRASVPFPSEGAALPGFVPGIGWSDHWSFSREGYPALMITDTAPFRYPHYHQITDVPTHLDYDRMARVVAGVEQVLQDLLQHGAR